MSEKYITIKELSAICGVSEQAIRAWCRRNQVAKLAKGSFAINESTKMAILKHYRVNERNQVAKLTKPSCETCETKNVDEKTLILLEKEIEILNNQLKVKDQQIQSLTQALDQQQQLNAMTVKQLENTQKKEINSSTEELIQYKDELAKLQIELENEKSKSWWDKLRGK